MHSNEIEKTIIKYIKELSEESGRSLAEVKKDQSIIEELGLTSLQIATLVSFLETEFGVDPFSTGSIGIMDVNTVEDLCQVYETCIKQGK